MCVGKLSSWESVEEREGQALQAGLPFSRCLFPAASLSVSISTMRLGTCWYWRVSKETCCCTAKVISQHSPRQPRGLSLSVFFFAHSYPAQATKAFVCPRRELDQGADLSYKGPSSFPFAYLALCRLFPQGVITQLYYR